MTTELRILQRQPMVAGDGLPADLHPVVRRILRHRGVGDAKQLDLQLNALLRPDAMGGLNEAAALIAEAVLSGRHIRVVGDFDADGATGTAVLVRGLALCGYHQVDFAVPNRFDFGYGLSVGLVDTFAGQPPDLLITVDSGISSLNGVLRARELGCQVIVTDHHLPGDTLPAADAIVNPNVHGDDFPSKALAGVGVVFYLLSGVRQALQQRGWFSAGRPLPKLGQLLDLVALGTVADLVPLDHNNRVLVHQGLQRIRAGRACAGIQALLKVGRREAAQAVASDLGFIVGPRLNAAGRLEDMTVGIRCLLTDDPAEAMHLAEWLDTLNRERQALQSDMEQQAQQIVQQQLDTLDDGRLPLALCLYQEDWHQGVVGLVASRIKDAVHRPVIAFAPEAEGSTVLKGSARSIRGIHIRDLLAWVDASQPGLMRAFGGHAMAAGLTLEQAQLNAFDQALQQGLAQMADEELFQPLIETDGELGHADFTLELAMALREIAPWGQQFPEPLFEGCFEVLDRRVVGAAHLRLQLRPLDGGAEIEAIAFNTAPEAVASGQVRLLYRLSVNTFRGLSCQLMVERIIE
ncbi:MAG: single-stranded-DNA-specific exonuclease RecJ [Wenzhouxiangellaceae bacterium]